MIIGLTGKMQSGKDTVCRMIQGFLPGAERRAFADPLKDSVCALFDVDRESLDKWKLDTSVVVSVFRDTASSCETLSQSFTIREILQRYGTEAHRKIFGDDFWVKHSLPGYKSDYVGKLLVFTDVRFDNEARRIQELGGFNIKIERLRNGFDVGASHASERALDRDLVTHILTNNGTLLDLKAEVGHLLRVLGLL